MSSSNSVCLCIFRRENIVNPKRGLSPYIAISLKGIFLGVGILGVGAYRGTLHYIVNTLTGVSLDVIYNLRIGQPSSTEPVHCAQHFVTFFSVFLK